MQAKSIFVCEMLEERITERKSFVFDHAVFGHRIEEGPVLNR
jgi:hypothetical protein